MVSVGIPRSLGYFEFNDLWDSFFRELGVHVVYSPPTNKAILDAGVRLAADGTCLPVKAFHGHVDYLLTSTPHLDFLFVPRLISVHRQEFICPKFIGLPDLTQNLLRKYPKSGVRVLAPTIDLRKGSMGLYLSLLKLSQEIKGPVHVFRAYKKALNHYREPRKQIIFTSKEGMTIGVIGHSYLLEDSFLSMDILKKLRSMNVRVVPSYMLSSDLIEAKAREWPKRMFWRSGKIALGSARAFTQGLPYPVHGVIYAASFGCGTDSITNELVDRALRRAGIPILTINLDEHTGEGGVLTRLEAFVDLIRWRSLHGEMYIPSHGQSLHSSSCAASRVGL